MITFQDVCFNYHKERVLFQHFDLRLKAGSITGLLGKNGAGKTTLLKLISGLLYPLSGDIEVLTHEPRRREPSFLSQVFFVPEEFFLPPVTIKGYLAANSAFYPLFSPDLMGRLLKEFQLSVHERLDSISYGQKKKFLISFALASKCPLLILDEPTNGLDIPSKTIFRKVMAGSLDSDQLVLISTHQVRDVESLVDRLVIIDDGRIAFDHDVPDIETQIHFTIAREVDEQVLYSEVAPGGYKCITRQRNGGSPVDIELLFNAVTQGKKIF